MSQNLEKITQLVAERNAKTARIAEIEPKEAYLRKFEKIDCPTGQIRNTCLSYNAARVGEANVFLAEINALKSQINSIDQQIKVLESVQIATNTATVTLAQTGQSLEALTIAAEGQSKASIEAATIKANAEAQAIKTNSNLAADNSKQRNMIFIAIAIIVALVIGYIIYTKYK